MVHRTLVPDSDADSLAREPLTFIRVNQQQREYSATLEPELLLTWILAALRGVGPASLASPRVVQVRNMLTSTGPRYQSVSQARPSIFRN